MSDTSQGDGWWQASDLKWYPPELHPDYEAPSAATDPGPSAAETVVLSETPGFEPGPRFSPADPATPPAQADPTATLPVFGSTPGPETPAAPSDDDPFGLPAASATGSAGSDRTGKIVLGVGAVILIAALGFLAFRLFGGGDATGGAATPEDAIDQLIASIADGDAVGLTQAFDPDEVDAWVGSFSPTFDAFADLADPQSDTAEAPVDEVRDMLDEVLDAFDFDVTGLDGDEVSYTVETLDDQGRIAHVRVDGFRMTVGATEGEQALIMSTPDTVALDLDAIDGTSIEVRDGPGGLQASVEIPKQGTNTETLDDVHLDFVTVEKDGRWYISPGYTMLELARSADGSGIVRPDFGRAFSLVESGQGGAAEPEGAVRSLFSSLERLDYGEMIALTDPYGLPYLHDYQNSIDAQVDPTMTRDVAGEFDLSIDLLDLSRGEWNGRTVVFLDEIAGGVAGGSFLLDTATWCASATSPEGDVSQGCLVDAIEEGLYQVDGPDVDAHDLLPDKLGIVVVERNGRWFIDPLGTVGYLLDQIADSVADIISETEVLEVAPIGPSTIPEFAITRGPIVSGSVAETAGARDGAAGLAFNLNGFEQPDLDTFAPMRVALIRLDGAGTVVAPGEPKIEGRSWGVAWAEESPEPIHPALIVNTDGDVTGELVETSIVEIDGPWTGEIDDDGRPIVVTFGDSVGAFDVEGSADFTTVGDWQAIGTFVGGDSQSFGHAPFTTFGVIHGPPGSTISIVPTGGSPFDERSVDDPSANAFAEPLVELFAATVEPYGFDHAFDQQGGYFDGCGADDPDVMTHAFEDPLSRLLAITPYPSEARASEAFEALATISTPCDAYPDLEIDSVTRDRQSNSLTILYHFGADPTQYYEWYAQRGDAIVVATGTTYDDILAGWELLADFPA